MYPSDAGRIGCLPTGLPRRLHVDLGGAVHEVGVSVFFSATFLATSFPLAWDKTHVNQKDVEIVYV